MVIIVTCSPAAMADSTSWVKAATRSIAERFGRAPPCWGESRKPDWMNGGDAEREGAQKIKFAVKESMSRRVALRASSKRQTRRRVCGVLSQESSLSTEYRVSTPDSQLRDIYIGASEDLDPSADLQDGSVPYPLISCELDNPAYTIVTNPPLASNQTNAKEITPPVSSDIQDLVSFSCMDNEPFYSSVYP
jgi:hypothetical protein